MQITWKPESCFSFKSSVNENCVIHLDQLCLNKYTLHFVSCFNEHSFVVFAACLIIKTCNFQLRFCIKHSSFIWYHFVFEFLLPYCLYEINSLFATYWVVCKIRVIGRFASREMDSINKIKLKERSQNLELYSNVCQVRTAKELRLACSSP